MAFANSITHLFFIVRGSFHNQEFSPGFPCPLFPRSIKTFGFGTKFPPATLSQWSCQGDRFGGPGIVRFDIGSQCCCCCCCKRRKFVPKTCCMCRASCIVLSCCIMPSVRCALHCACCGVPSVRCMWHSCCSCCIVLVRAEDATNVDAKTVLVLILFVFFLIFLKGAELPPALKGTTKNVLLGHVILFLLEPLGPTGWSGAVFPLASKSMSSFNSSSSLAINVLLGLSMLILFDKLVLLFLLIKEGPIIACRHKDVH